MGQLWARDKYGTLGKRVSRSGGKKRMAISPDDRHYGIPSHHVIHSTPITYLLLYVGIVSAGKYIVML